MDIGTALRTAGDWLTQLGPALTVIGTLLALWALREARRQSRLAIEQTKQLAAHEDRLASIWNSLSTRYLGQFPNYNQEIASLLTRARRSIVMFYDLPGYGVFSNRSAWLQIQQVVQRKTQDGLDLDVTVYDEQRRQEIITEQMEQEGTGFESWLRSEDTREDLAAFAKDYGGLTDLADLDATRYVELSLQAHRQILVEAFRGVSVKEVTADIPLYFWMIDGEEAIISIPIFSGESTEHGFRTSDRSFIAALLELKRKYMRATDTATD